MSRPKKAEGQDSGFPVLDPGTPAEKKTRVRKAPVLTIAKPIEKPKVKIPKSITKAMFGAFERLNKVAEFIKANQ